MKEHTQERIKELDDLIRKGFESEYEYKIYSDGQKINERLKLEEEARKTIIQQIADINNNRNLSDTDLEHKEKPNYIYRCEDYLYISNTNFNPDNLFMNDLENYLKYAIDTVTAAHEKHNQTLLKNGIGRNRRCTDCNSHDGRCIIKVNSLYNNEYKTSYCKQSVVQLSNASYNNMSLDSTSPRGYYSYTLNTDSDSRYLIY